MPKPEDSTCIHSFIEIARYSSVTCSVRVPKKARKITINPRYTILLGCDLHSRPRLLLIRGAINHLTTSRATFQ